jgi:hypothetical protein
MRDDSGACARLHPRRSAKVANLFVRAAQSEMDFDDLRRMPGVTARSAAGRRYRELVNVFVDALGGEAGLDKRQRKAVRSAAELTTAAEMQRARMLRGERVDMIALLRLDGNAVRAVRALQGLTTSQRKGRK